MNGPKLGRPSQGKEDKQQLQSERAESGERSAIQCCFGVAKRRYSLNLIKTRLADTSEVSIRVALLTLNLFKKLTLLFAFFFNRLLFGKNRMGKTDFNGSSVDTKLEDITIDMGLRSFLIFTAPNKYYRIIFLLRHVAKM